MQSSPTQRRVLSILVIGATALPTLAQEEDAKRLFTWLDRATTELKPNQDALVQRYENEKTAVEVRIVRLNESVFSADRVVCNVAPDNQVTFEKDRTTRSPAGEDNAFTWTATRGDDLPVAQFYVHEDRVSGSVRAENFIYNVRPLGDGLHVIIKRDPEKLPPDHPEEFKAIENRATERSPIDRDAAPLADVPTSVSPVISVMVIYTTAVKSNHVSIDDYIDSLINIANQTYTDSAIPCQLALAHRAEVAYSESGSVASDVHRLIATSDGILDDVHALRDSHAADVVVMLIDGGDAAGYAGAILADAATAFAVADDEYADWYFTFAHEIGHLLGARHNPEADPSTSPFSYGHGYQHPLKSWRTVMAYTCAPHCIRIGRWSNPTASHEGHSTGTCDLHDNARVLRETAPIIALFR